MHTVTAIIRVKPGAAEAMETALLTIARRARTEEPGTVDYYVSRDRGDPCVFSTYERYADQAAMEAHNSSDAVAQFFRIAAPLLEGQIVVVMGPELDVPSA